MIFPRCERVKLVTTACVPSHFTYIVAVLRVYIETRGPLEPDTFHC